ncbi:indole-3-glycerol phosphate synthase TrpC [Acanthopleuribacter pedis]|uniref:Indole-3-glycerol phosphate synthase n=1 Tax=Acanthopleuribacter pedis TaxID=442870 RepID=A0A8J7QLW1_9BACT|nr:indole-3-glycerol phosphate synthase TrpC [Acanthopleuribacter pedis]MBO1320365.1 indole-3-glycerol phosphate synthase TrpC [Acanthopleuribacter pedis]
MDILSQIVADTVETIKKRKQTLSLNDLQARAGASSHPHHSLKAKVAADPKPHIIAEFKRKSPSRPNINMNADPVAVAQTYEAGGASAMSVLTEPDYFAGAPEDLQAVRRAVAMPLLRKDFVVDPYQLFEAKAWGADLVLLIARILEPAQLAELNAAAQELGLETLCEVHNREELAVVGTTPVDFLGVNCRDLKKFSTNLDQLIDIVDDLPDHAVWVAESGIGGREDVARLEAVGYRAFLVGEHLMRNTDPGAEIGNLRGNPA